MAVVFISPKQRQKVFFLGITVIFSLFIVFVSVVVFFSGPQKVEPALVFNKPKVSIDMTVFDSDQFKNLIPFSEMQMQFSYVATTKANKKVTGVISAASQDEATKTLTGLGLTVTSIKAAIVGRDNPFTPYYQATTPVKTTTK